MQTCPKCTQGVGEYRPLLCCGWCGDLFDKETDALINRLAEAEGLLRETLTDAGWVHGTARERIRAFLNPTPPADEGGRE